MFSQLIILSFPFLGDAPINQVWFLALSVLVMFFIRFAFSWMVNKSFVRASKKIFVAEEIIFALFFGLSVYWVALQTYKTTGNYNF